MKKLFQRSAALIITAAMLICSASCSGGNDSGKKADDTTAATTTTAAETTAAETEPEAPAEKTYIADETNVKLLGRTLLDDNNVLWLAHSASGIEFKFSGTKASVALKGDAATGNPDGRARFAVYVDGERKLDEMLDAPEKSYDIYSSDSAKEVTVRLVKLSESTSSAFGIVGITADAALTPAPAKDIKIEFIGDSITCGYGVDDEDKNHHFSTKTEDATKTYAYKTAEALGADYSMVCYSGHGIISGYTGDGKKNTDGLVPPVYEQFAKTYTTGGYFDEKTPWDFSRFAPDYIVINLGTNDSSYIKTKEAREEFIVAYEEFIKQVRNDNPDSFIVCIIGTMGNNAGVAKAVNNYLENTGDNKIYYLQMPQQNEGKNGLAADWHPTEKTHAEAADRLTDTIRKIISGELPAAAA